MKTKLDKTTAATVKAGARLETEDGGFFVIVKAVYPCYYGRRLCGYQITVQCQNGGMIYCTRLSDYYGLYIVE